MIMIFEKKDLDLLLICSDCGNMKEKTRPFTKIKFLLKQTVQTNLHNAFMKFEFHLIRWNLQQTLAFK